MKNTGRYDDIIELPHYISKKHPQLGKDSYAAQFSPFAALSGYDGIISETARITDERIELGESDLEILSAKFIIINEHIKEEPTLTFTYFKEDSKKAGGSYLEKTAQLKRIDEIERIFYFTDGTKLSLDDVVDINGNLFDALENEYN